MRLVLTLLAALTVTPFTARTAQPARAAACSVGLTITLHPGLPPSAKNAHLPIARDIPRGHFTVSVPVYPGATPLSQFVASPIPEYQAGPYLQTGVAEYRTSAGPAPVMAWYRAAFLGCGWMARGSMATNVGILTEGLTFASAGNPNLSVEMTFGQAPGGGTYIAYVADEITYPARPAASYLRGPFNQVRIALQKETLPGGPSSRHTLFSTLVDRSAIQRLVQAINSLTGYQTTSGVCAGGVSSIGPAWLSFRRPDGPIVHAFETGPGACLGLTVNGVRSLVDDGRVWNLIIRITRQQHAKALVLPFMRTWHGPGISRWFRLKGGSYDFSARYQPRGCATDIAFVGTNGYHVADIRNVIPGLPGLKPGGKWSGWTMHLVAGIYRIEGRQVSSTCTWSVRVTRT